MKKKNMKKKNSNLSHEDESRFNRVLQRLRHHDKPNNKNKECPLSKPKKSHRPTMSIGSENSNSSTLALLFSQEAKENMPPEFTQSMVDTNKKKKKKKTWKWKPLKSLGSHSSGEPLPCILSVYVDSIHGLPSMMIGMQCVVKLYKKNGGACVWTRPYRVINGTVDIDETLRIESFIIRGKHECSIWVSVSVIEMGGSGLSTHCVDLSRVVPEACGVDSPVTWATTFKLTGKGKGALLAVTFACQLVRDWEEGGSADDVIGMKILYNTPESEIHGSTSPTVSELDLNEVPLLESLSLEENKSIDPRVEDTKKEFEDQKNEFCDVDNSWGFPNLPAEKPLEAPTSLLPCKVHLTSTCLNKLDNMNDGNISVVNGGREDDDVTLGVEDSGVEMEYYVLEQGVEMGTMSTEGSPGEKETNPAEKKENDVEFKWWQGREYAQRGFREHMQVIEEELEWLEARIDANDCWKRKFFVDESYGTEDVFKETVPLDDGHVEGNLIKQSAIYMNNTMRSSFHVDGSWKIEENLTENLCINESRVRDDSIETNQSLDRNWKHLEEDEKNLEEVFLNEIQDITQDNRSSDEDTDSVTNEFLNLLERGGIADDITLKRESISSSESLPREFELDCLLQEVSNLDTELDKEMHLSFSDTPDMKIHKAEQALRSKTRAKILEDAETQALMQKWGLNEDVFELSPPKSSCLFPSGNLTVNSIFSSHLEEGMGSLVQTRDGGYIRSMNPGLFANSKVGGKLVMHVSKPVVIPTEMGSTGMEILRKMAAIGMDNLASQTMMAMPLEDVTGNSVLHISVEGSNTLEGPFQGDQLITCDTRNTSEKPESHLVLSSSDDTQLRNGANLGFEKEESICGGRSIQLKSPKDLLDGYVSAEDLAPLAIQKLEALALEGLRIQSNMANEDAPSYVDSLPFVGSDNLDAKMGDITGMDGVASIHMIDSKLEDKGTNQMEGTMASAIPLQKWIELNAGFPVDAGRHTTKTTESAQRGSLPKNSKNDKRREQKDSCSSSTNVTITIAMLVQLRDPLRNYEPVGVPMIALIQAEQVMKHPCLKLSKQASTRIYDESEDDEPEQQKAVQMEPQFKIIEVHVAGLRAPETEKKKGWFFQKWGSKKQEQSGSRWLIANGMSKTNKPTLPKSKPSSSQLKTTLVKPGETLWSISSRVHGTGSKWQEIASLNPHIRNPDIIFPNQTIRTR